VLSPGRLKPTQILRIQRLENQLGSNNDRFIQRPVHWTPIREEAMYAICRLPLGFFGFQFEPHVNSLDDKHIFLELDFTQCLGDQALV
jgi:hypothetical protein